MRNKEQFVEDVKSILQPEVLAEYQIVEDASHTMNNLEQCHFTVPSKFTTTGKDETFLFESVIRPSTDENDKEDVLDYLYLKKEESKWL